MSLVVPCFAELGKDAREAIVERVGHRVDGKRDVEAEFVRKTCVGLYADAGRNSGKHELADAETFQIGFEIGAGEGTPCLFSHTMIGRLPIELSFRRLTIRPDLRLPE